MGRTASPMWMSSGGMTALGFFAGWALVIVIQDPRERLRNLTVLNGFAHVDGNPVGGQPNPNNSVTIPVTGFLTPQTGAVTTHLGVVSYEGDLGLTGDTITLNGQQLSDAVHAPDNFFNAGIARLGAHLTNKTPHYKNQLGFDIAVVDASGILPNGATSATFEFFSAAEIYYPGVFTFATDLFLPVVEVVKTVRDLDGGEPLPGDILEYTIALKNIGNDGAVNQVLTAPIPADTAYVPGSLRITTAPPGASTGSMSDAADMDMAELHPASNSVVFRLGTGATATAGGRLAPDQSTTVVFRVQINAAAPPASLISNQAVATYHSQTLPNLSTDVRSDSALTTPGKQPTDVIVGEVRAPLTLSTSAAPDPVVAGQRLTYTFEVTNAGPNSAANVVFADATPLHTTFVSATAPPGWTMTQQPPVGGTGPIIFENPNVPPDIQAFLSVLGTVSTVRDVLAAPPMFTIVVQVDPTAPSGTRITHIATLTSDTGPQSLLDETTVTVSGEPELSITKTDGQTSTVPGAVLTYTLVVRNAGPSAVTGARVTDPVPATLRGVTWTCAASPGSSCPASGTEAIDVLVDLLVGGTATFTLSATVNPAVQGGTIVNEATVEVPPGTVDPDLTNNTARDANTVVAEADIAVHKRVNNATPVAGDEVTFTVTATNNGPNPATGVKLSDGVPPGLTLVLPHPVPPSQGIYTPNTGNWDIGTLAVGAQATLTLVARVAQAGLIRNVATKIAGDQFDPDPSNNSSGVALTDQPVADIRVRTTTDTLVLPIGADVTLTVTVSNEGPSPATGVALTDLLPAGLVLVSATPRQGTYTPTTGVWTLGALAVGAQTTLILRATVQEVGAFTNRAAKTAQGELDPNPNNDVSGVTVNGEAADVQVVTTVDRTMPLVVGDPVTFTVTVTNNGPNAVSGVEVLDVLSARLAFVSATLSQGTYTAATGRWAVGALAAVGAAATATLQVTATVAEPGPLTNLAVKIAQDQPDPNPANDQDSVAPPGLPVADLVVTKSNGVDRVVPGTEVVYTVVVTNRGPSPVIGATVSDPIPLLLRDPTRGLRAFEDLTWTCAASVGSACPAGGMGDVLATVDLLVGGMATLTLRGRVTPAAVGTVGNTGTVTAPAEVLDPLLGNNSATDTDRLTPLADLSITKTDEVQSVVPGTLVRYTLVVRNAGPSTVRNARVQDPASAALMGVRWTCVASVGSICPAEGSGPIATTVNLASGGTVTFTLTGTVTADAMGTLANTTTVTPPSGVTDPALGNNTVTDTNAVLPPAAFGPPSGRKTVQEGAFPDLEWRVVWLNPANAVPLRIQGLDPMPVATTYVDGSVTCVARGQSTVARCDFDAATNHLIYDGIVGADPGATTEEHAANAVIITFRTAVLPGVTQVVNQALAHWDATGTGTVHDDISAGQVPVRTGTEFGRSDPTVAPLSPLACLFQQRLLALALTGPAPGGPTDTSPTDGQDGAVDAGVDRQNAPGPDGVLMLSTPLDSDAVAGTTVTLAAVRAPISGTVVSQPAEIRIANAVPADTLDLVENVGSKAERVPAREAHDVLTADGVGVEFPVTALAAADILRLERVDPTTTPGPLPGVAVSPLVAVTLAGGGTAFSGSVTLSLPYPDAEPDGLVDGTSPAVPELTLTAWRFNTARGIWVRLPEARVFPAFHEVLVSIAQPGLYGVFQAADGSTGLAGTTGPASPAPRSAGAQGSGWQDIGVVTTFPFLVPLNTTTLPNGTYEVRAVCATTPTELRAAAGSAPTTSTVLGTSGGGGGCSLRPRGGWSRATALDALGNLGLPLVMLLGFKAFEAAQSTLTGIALMHRLRKGQLEDGVE